ncbi:MAG: cell division ATP-binding protein FtsE [Clostridia bacterium]|nr:cell division ATP-binding protein FtsE [Clostridia bacterium]
MIEFRNVTVVYDNNVIGLDNVSFHIDKGEFVFLVGKTGAGKSSAIKLLTGEIKPYSGEVDIDGTIVSALKHRQVPYHRRRLGVVFQDYRLLQNKTVYENVAFAMEIVGAPKSEIRQRVPQILNLVGLSRKARVYPKKLSGGEQQRVCIARALVNSPTMVIADEPTGNLDPDTSKEIMGLLEEINSRGTTIVMVTHDEKIVNDMRKRVIRFESGMLVSDKEKGVYSLDN